MCKTKDFMGIALAVLVGSQYVIITLITIDGGTAAIWKLLLQLLLHILLA